MRSSGDRGKLGGSSYRLATSVCRVPEDKLDGGGIIAEQGRWGLTGETWQALQG